MNVCLMFAMKEEAAPFLEPFQEILGREDLTVYRHHRLGLGKLYVVISGIGAANTMVAAMFMKENFGVNHIINIGSCGANYQGIENAPVIGDIVRPLSFIQGDFDLSAFGNNTKTPSAVDNDEGLLCLTYQRFVTEKVAEPPYIVDMDAYFLKTFCDRNHMEFAAFKVISDCADSEAADTFTKNIEEVTQNSVEIVGNYLRNCYQAYCPELRVLWK